MPEQHKPEQPTVIGVEHARTTLNEQISVISKRIAESDEKMIYRLLELKGFKCPDGVNGCPLVGAKHIEQILFVGKPFAAIFTWDGKPAFKRLYKDDMIQYYLLAGKGKA